MRVDWAGVEDLLRGITEKKIDPESAARALLGFDSTVSLIHPIASPASPIEPSESAPSNRFEPQCDLESMHTLVQRLGPPPPEIEEDWKRQIQSVAKSWHARESRPLPPLTLDDWLVDAQNRISLSPRIMATSHHRGPFSPAIQPEVESSTETTSFATDKTTAKQPKTRKQRRAKTPAIAASIATAALVLLLALIASRQSAPETSPEDSSLSIGPADAPTRKTGSPSPFEPGFIAQQPPADEPLDLQPGVMALAENTTPFAQPSPPQPIQPDFGFDNPLLSRLPIVSPQPTANDITSGQDSSDPSTESASTPPPDHRNGSDTDWDEQAADATGPEGSATIADQPVESATPRQAVTLPLLRNASPLGEAKKEPPTDNSTLIGVNLISDVQWDFPQATNLRFASSEPPPTNDSDERPKRWLWTDTTSGAELAILDQADHQLFFRWAEQTTANPLSRQIAAGRLRLTDSTGQSSTIFLRPHLRTSPLRLDATEPDVRFSWPLEGPAIYQAPSLNLEATEPEKVDMSWVEPPDPTNIRKQIATLQWTPEGKPSPAIRCRIECKATTKLQMRLRYFAQLDSTFPWQSYSASQLITALDQVTQLLERRTAELSQIENQYRNATTSERRSIRPIKESIEQAVAQLRSILQQLQQLNILHSAVVATSHLQLTLTTDWPDGPQTILEIPLPDK
jgi:hypothetical protein